MYQTLNLRLPHAHIWKVIGRQSEGSLIRGFDSPRVRQSSPNHNPNPTCEICCLSISDSSHYVGRETSQRDVISMADDRRDVQQRMRRGYFRFTVTSMYHKPCHVWSRLALGLAFISVRCRMVCN